MESTYDIVSRRPIHPFPARMAPRIAVDAIDELASGGRVADPMSGSGTVLAVAQARGHEAWGGDMDPLAVLVADVWTQPVNPAAIVRSGERVLYRAKQKFRRLRQASAYPVGSTEATREFVRFWFDGYARRQLAALSTEIIAERRRAVRKALWCALSRLIITKRGGASLAMDTSHSRPHRTYSRAPRKPFSHFQKAVRFVAANVLTRTDEKTAPRVTVQEADARSVPLKDSSIDLVITSPPYLNAIDYIRASKFSLVWMGHEIDDLKMVRRNSIGTAPGLATFDEDPACERALKAAGKTSQLPGRELAWLRRYVHDMSMSVSEVRRILVAGGRAVYVIGDSHLRGLFVRNSHVIKSLAKDHGLELTRRLRRAIPPSRRYLPPPTAAGSGRSLQARMREEVILEFAA